MKIVFIRKINTKIFYLNENIKNCVTKKLLLILNINFQFIKCYLITWIKLLQIIKSVTSFFVLFICYLFALRKINIKAINE